MKRLVACVVLGLLAACSNNSINPQLYSRDILVDLYHGSIDPISKSAIERYGIQIHTTDAPITDKTLAAVGAVWITSNATRDFEPSELRSIHKFIRSGGTLICSGQAWAWAYDKKEVSKFPLNQLGKTVGFLITGQNAGKPVNMESSPYLMDVDSVNQTDWWPSLVQSEVNGFVPLIRDEYMRTIAIYFPLGRGRVFVFGHESLLKDNPQITVNILKL